VGDCQNKCEISSSHGGEYDVQSCLLGYTVDNHFTRQYNPEDSYEHHVRLKFNRSSFNTFGDEVCGRVRKLTDTIPLNTRIRWFCVIRTKHL
jgi:hypothetical protein